MPEEVQGNDTTQNKDTILIVEDDPFLYKIITQHLEGEEGLDVLSAQDGETALKEVEKSKPKLILLDIILPGMDGFEVLEKLKASPDTKDIPVVILSNLGQQEDIEKGKKLGAEDFLVKAHYSPNEIVEKIKEILKKQ